jgi:hypothetical protein
MPKSVICVQRSREGVATQSAKGLTMKRRQKQGRNCQRLRGSQKYREIEHAMEKGGSTTHVDTPEQILAARETTDQHQRINDLLCSP